MESESQTRKRRIDGSLEQAGWKIVPVDMLSTGVDIPALEFIVFLRPVKSRILWEQMLGRGTRQCVDINKSHWYR
jgi:type I site-specific restriction endonuclease